MVLQRCDCNVKSLPLQQREHKIQVQTNQMFCCISRFRARVGGTASLTRPPYERISLHDGQKYDTKCIDGIKRDFTYAKSNMP